MSARPLLWHFLRNPALSTPQCSLVSKLTHYAPRVAQQLSALGWGYGRECSVSIKGLPTPPEWHLQPKHQSVAGMADILAQLLTPQELAAWQSAEPSHPWVELIEIALHHRATPLHLVYKSLAQASPPQPIPSSWTWAPQSFHAWSLRLSLQSASSPSTLLRNPTCTVKFHTSTPTNAGLLSLPLTLFPGHAQGQQHLGSALIAPSHFASHPASPLPSYIVDNQLDILRSAAQVLSSTNFLGWSLTIRSL